MKQILTATILGLAVVMVTGGNAYASNLVSNISFPQCPNPGGTQVAGYESGTHQIPGGTRMEGSDYVYRLVDGKYVQCFCPPESSNNDTGIQSNWLHQSVVSSTQWNTLRSQGWMVIENGSDWGLPAGAYLVKNHHFDCEGDECVRNDNKGQDHAKKIKVKHVNKIMVKQHNQANIDNHVNVNANTGNNTVSGNTGEGSLVLTGDIHQEVDIHNMANMNLALIAQKHPDLYALLSR